MSAHLCSNDERHRKSIFARLMVLEVSKVKEGDVSALMCAIRKKVADYQQQKRIF